MRLFIVFLMVGSFAILFAILVRFSDGSGYKPLPTASRCGDAIGAPCLTQRML